MEHPLAPTAPAQTLRKMSLPALVAVTFFMVSGGPYGLEELVRKAGFQVSILILLVTPFLWSLPTALMLGELASAIPAEGGFYVWVGRALGPFWGFQEAWLSLAASVFDMAIYPTLFVLYLARIFPWAGQHPVLVGAALIAVCTTWNLAGAKAVGDSSLVMAAALLLPFVVLAGLSLVHGKLPVLAPMAEPKAGADFLGGVLIAMWNYMGWDNASTVAGEVEDPQRTYPRAMFATVVLVAAAYVATVALVGRTGIDPSTWETGAWVDVAARIAGPWLSWALVLGGMLCGLGMFNALLLSYSRLPAALADDGYLPKVFARRLPDGAPWVAVVVLALLWTSTLGLSFDRLVMIDVLIYGTSLILEFVALAVLRHREPDLPRPYRVPGGTLGAWLLGLPPAALIVLAFLRNRSEAIGGVSSLAVGLAVMGAGVLYYGGHRLLASQRATVEVEALEE
ncbi:MAG TPA: APC family permease [Holophagaceae bacterium]|nr:APC family permease [Holophagaceae bacterium]